MADLEHRRTTKTLHILNADGTPAAEQTVRFDQMGHQFLFGCGAFDAVYMMKAQNEEQRAVLAEFC